MSNISGLKSIATRTLGRTALYAQKHSPEILTGAAVVGVVATAVLAVRASKKIEPIIHEAQDQILEARGRNRAFEEAPSGDEYTRSEMNRDIAHVYIKTGLKSLKVYGPTITTGLTTIGCVLGAHGIMKKRNVAIAAGYKALESSFNEYRDRVAAQLGEDEEKDLYNGHVIVEEKDEKTGKTKKVKQFVGSVDRFDRTFDENNKNWSGIHDYNEMFLRHEQDWLNKVLRSRGHVFLNEVYDRLGFERTPEGQLAGWVWQGEGDNIIDFGIDVNLDSPSGQFQGVAGVYHLTFNFDGNIYDQI